MAEKKFLVDINLDQNQLKQVRIENLPDSPVPSGYLGQVYYSTTVNKLKVCTNTNPVTWTEVGSGTSYKFDELPLPSPTLTLTLSGATAITGTIYEKGSSVTYSATASYATSSGTSTPTSIDEINGGFSSFPSSNYSSTVTGTTTDDKEFSFRINAPREAYYVSGTSIKAPSGSISSPKKSATISFVRYYYFGYSGSATIASGDIINLATKGYSYTNDPVISKNTLTIDNVNTTGTGGYVHFCYPTTMPELSSIIQNGATPVLSTYDKKTVSVTNASGSTLDYYVYTSITPNSYPGTNSLKFIF